MISTVTTTTTTVTTAEVMTYSIIAVVLLLLFLALREILNAGAHKNKSMGSFVKRSNIAIIPLLLVFAAVMAYKLFIIL
jgi:hypothetical protein